MIPQTEENLCDTCRKSFETCDAVNIVFGIDQYPSCKNGHSNCVKECDGYSYKDNNLMSQTVTSKQ